MLLMLGDNWTTMRDLGEETIDLVCLSPPMHVGELDDWNTPLSAMFADNCWAWNEESEKVRTVISMLAKQNEDYAILEKCLEGFDSLLLHSTEGNMGGIRDYLTFICPRIVEMKRLLKTGGSFYYVGFVFVHYLKCLFDTLFGEVGNNEIEHYKKELVIETGAPIAEDIGMWQNTHLLSLYYPKGTPNVWNPPVKQLGSIWHGYDIRNCDKDERIPFRYKSPNVLYDRWISVSTNPGDRVLDAFCGSGTALDSAHAQGRDWVGIDNAEDAIQASIYRMWLKHGLVPVKDYRVILNGFHATLPDVEAFVKKSVLDVNFSDMFDSAMLRGAANRA